MSDFFMPTLGADMESGTVVNWYIKPGDIVQRGDVVAEVETHKGNIEVEIWQSGKVTELVVAEGSEVPVGTLLAKLEGGSETESTAEKVLSSAAATPETKSIAKTYQPIQKHSHRVRITPVARLMAESFNINLEDVEGTGIYGGICKQDIEVYLARQKQGQIDFKKTIFTTPPVSEKPSQTKTGLQAEKYKLMRSAIADAMSRSNREIPHYYLQTTLELSGLNATLEKMNHGRSITSKVLPTAFFVKAVASGCKKYPEMNGFWKDGAYQPEASINIGVAIALRKGGLVAPAILNADQKNVDQINTELLDLVARARTGKLKSSEVNSSTITLTSMGDLGADIVYGVIYPPQVALVGIGAIKEKPWAENGMLGIKPQAVMTLAADHRASDGQRGSLFLKKVEDELFKLVRL